MPERLECEVLQKERYIQEMDHAYYTDSGARTGQGNDTDWPRVQITAEVFVRKVGHYKLKVVVVIIAAAAAF